MITFEVNTGQGWTHLATANDTGARAYITGLYRSLHDGQKIVRTGNTYTLTEKGKTIAAWRIRTHPEDETT